MCNEVSTNKGNKIANKATRMRDVTDIPFGEGEIKAILKNEMMKKWQDRWDGDINGRKY